MNKMEVAKEIQRQIGNQALFMLGARHFVCGYSGKHDDGNPYLSFRIRGSKKANAVRIELEPSDTYKITFSKIRGLTVKEVARHEFIYADQLHEIIRKETGLATNL